MLFGFLKDRSKLVEGLEGSDIPQQELWKRIGEAVRGVLDTTTIEDLMKSGEKDDRDSYMFYI